MRMGSNINLNLKPSCFLVFSLIAIVFFIPAPTYLNAGGIPDWMKEATMLPLPEYKAETNAVILLEARTVTPMIGGKYTLKGRRVIKILRNEDVLDFSALVLPDKKTSKVLNMTGWRLDANGKSEKFGFKQALNSDLDSDSLYTDIRKKILSIPDVLAGDIIAFEWEVENTPYSMENLFYYQGNTPVRKCLYTVNLFNGMECDLKWINREPLEPLQLSAESPQRSHTWEWENVSAIEEEPLMPDYGSVRESLQVRFNLVGAPDISFRDWKMMGTWYTTLTKDAGKPSDEIKKKTFELISGAKDTQEKLRVIGDYIQKEIRYVSIMVGDGDFQPHPASTIFETRFGDCKDKVTLLSAMLRVLNIETYYILVNIGRGKVKMDSTVSFDSFNHAIAAIKLPVDVPDNAFFSMIRHPELGRLLIYDPTHPCTPIGQLPYYLQGNTALLAAGENSGLLELSLPTGENNLLDRTGRFKLMPMGTLQGDVVEKRRGIYADILRRNMQKSTLPERIQYMENFLSIFFIGATFESMEIENLMDFHKDLIISYRVRVPNYVKNAGNFFVFRPCVLGKKAEPLESNKKKTPRRFPIELESTSLQRDEFSIEIPLGWTISEIPPGVDLKSSFASYHSKIVNKENMLVYEREYHILDPFLSSKKFDEAVKFFRCINTDEQQAGLIETK